MAFRSVLHLLDEIEQSIILKTQGTLQDSKVAPDYDMELIVERTTLPYGEFGLKYNDKVDVLVFKK